MKSKKMLRLQSVTKRRGFDYDMKYGGNKK